MSKESWALMSNLCLLRNSSTETLKTSSKDSKISHSHESKDEGKYPGFVEICKSLEIKRFKE